MKNRVRLAGLLSFIAVMFVGQIVIAADPPKTHTAEFTKITDVTHLYNTNFGTTRIYIIGESIQGLDGFRFDNLNMGNSSVREIMRSCMNSAKLVMSNSIKYNVVIQAHGALDLGGIIVDYADAESIICTLKRAN